MPPLPLADITHDRDMRPLLIGRAWTEQSMHAYARQYAAEVAGPLVEALEKIASETAATWVSDAARAALAAYKESAK